MDIAGHPTWLADASLAAAVPVWTLILAILLAATTGAVTLLGINRKLNREMAERRRIEGELRTLHGIITAQNLRFDAKMRALLDLGCKSFAMPVGILSRVEDQHYEIMAAVTPDGGIERGAVYTLGDDCCRRTLASDGPVTCQDAGEVLSHPALPTRGLNAYLGMRLLVDGTVYGTLNFAALTPGPQRITAGQRELLKLMAQWLEGEIQRRRGESEMRKLSSAIEQIADGVVITDRDGVIKYVNPAYRQMTGYAREELLGRTHALLRSGTQNQEFYERLWATIERGEPFREVFANRRKDGSLYYEEKTITPVKDWQGNIRSFVSTSKDITERIQAEEQLRQHLAELAHVARLGIMGEMASGLAHEINQPLAAIVNYAQGCVRRLKSGTGDQADLLEALEQITRQGERVGEIIRRLRSFIRKDEQRRERVDINDVAREAASLMREDARRGTVVLDLRLQEGLPKVRADSIQIEQVVLNLIRNAVEAMQEQPPGRRKLTLSSEPGDKAVELAVSDTGPGVPPAHMDRIFQPFFTTKSSDVGLGMGLSISRSIIEAHGGRLWMTSNPEGGCTFRLSLPSETEKNHGG